MATLDIKSIIETWKDFDIKKIQHDLDDKVIEIAQQLETGDKSRKTLIEKTKEFRKNLTDEQRKLVAPILKQFQLEIDGSTKRSKFMEQILLNLYKQLIDLPDPNPALENAQLKHKKAEKMQDLEIENKQLKNTLDEYHEEFAQVKNQEVTIKNLKEKIKEMELTNEQQIQVKLKEREKELVRSYVDTEEQMRTNQLDLVKKLGEVENKNLNYKSQIDMYQEELYELKQKQDEVLNAKTCEMEILLQDIDKATERAVNSERLAEQLQESIDNMSKEVTLKKNDEINQQQIDELKMNNLRTSSLEVELVAKEKEISQLVDDIQKLHMKSNKSREFYESQRTELEEKLTEKENNLERLESELNSKNDYEEIKRELNVFKAIELGNYSTNNHDSSNITNDSNSSQQPLEILLLEKNRNLQNENTQIKNKLSSLNSNLEYITKEHAELKQSNHDLQKLVVELEKDLLRVARNQKPDISKKSIPMSVLSLDIESNTESISIDLDENDNRDDDETKNDKSLFNIVSNQRERFKIKCQELESDNIASKQQIGFLTNELDQLRSDNLKLYEKIKFLQSAGNSKKANKYKQSDIEYDADSDESVLNKYTTAYENRLDPFSKFSYREKQRRYANLKLHDKFTLNFGRFILSSSTSRMIFCGYFIILHLLVFLNLYHAAHNASSKRDLWAECAHAYKNHMAEVHGKSDFHFD